MKKIRAILCGAITTVGIMMSNCISVFAADVDVQSLLDSNGAAADGGALAGINNAVDSYGQGGFSIGQKLGVYITGIVIVGFAIRLLVGAHNANKTAETKQSALPIVLGVVLIFGVVGVIAFLQGVGANLFSF